MPKNFGTGISIESTITIRFWRKILLKFQLAPMIVSACLNSKEQFDSMSFKLKSVFSLKSIVLLTH